MLDVLILMLLTMSINVPFMISTYLWCMAFFLSCDGNILSPPPGTSFTFLPGETRNIIWTFNDSINNVDNRDWFFTGSSNGSPQTRFANVVENNNVQKLSAPIPPNYDVYKPSTLQLRNITHIYDGTYEFQLRRKGDSLPSFISKVRVFVAMKPNATIECATPLVVSKGDNVSCICTSVGGNPPANVTWFDKDDRTVRAFEVESSATLVITDVTLNDSGSYRCKAQSYDHPDYRDEKSIDIQVKSKPTVMIDCSNPLVVNESDSVSCECRGEGGHPTANVTWFHKDNNIVNGIGEGSKELVLTNVTVNDGGNYRCKAESYNDPRFRDEKSIEIIVQYRPRNTNINLSATKVKKGQNVTISCESDGLPEPTYTIYHNGTDNTSAVSNNKAHIIESVNSSDAGSYRCEAKNKLGNELSDVKNLTVVNEAPISSSFSLSPSIITSSMTFTFTSSISSTSTTNVGQNTPTSKDDGNNNTTVKDDDDDGPNIALIVGISVGAVVLVTIIVVVIFWCYKSMQKNGYRSEKSVTPVVEDNHPHYELDGAPGVSNESHYESVNNDKTDKNRPDDESKPSENKPPVYASINRENRQGNPLYSSLDPKDAPKRDPTQKRPAPTEYASIDMSKLAPVEKKNEKKGDDKGKDEKKKDVVYL